MAMTRAPTRRKAGKGIESTTKSTTGVHASKPAVKRRKVIPHRVAAPSPANGSPKLAPEEVHALLARPVQERAPARDLAAAQQAPDWYAADADIEDQLARGC
jgi:hypothetical protein